MHEFWLGNLRQGVMTKLGRRGILTVCAGGLTSLLPWGAPRLSARQIERGPAALLVRGEAELAGGEMAWRVVRDVAELGDKAQFERRALGFAVSRSPFNDLLLTDQVTGSAYRLASREAAFVREGTMQRRESLAGGPDAYLRIGLVAVERVNDAGGDRLEFAGPGFSVPEGVVSLTLERIALDADETAYVTPGLGQALVLVEQGEIELEQGEAAPRERLLTVVGSDTYYAIGSLMGGTTLFAMRDATSVLVATIG
jgi:hypothetical protein